VVFFWVGFFGWGFYCQSCLMLFVVAAGDVGEVGLLVPGDAGLVHAVEVLVQLVAVEEDDLQADLTSGGITGANEDGFY